MVPNSIWFNVQRSVHELLDHLCVNHTLFRVDAVAPTDRRDMYPVYILEKFCPISHPVIAAIRVLPRNDGRTNEFIEDVVRSARKHSDRFSDKKRIIGHLASPDEPLINLLPTERKDDHSSAIIIGVPTGAVVRPNPRPVFEMFHSFIKEKFKWTTARGRGDQHRFKSEIVSYYDLAHPNDKGLLYDCSTGLFVGKDLLVAAHLWKNEWKGHWDSFWGDIKSNSSDPRNGMIWNRAVESAYDNGRITVYEDEGTLKWHVWDPSLQKIKIAADLMGFPDDKIKAKNFFGDITFGDLEGQSLHFPNDKRPFRRCLCLHAKLTKLAAVERGWIGAAEWDIDSYYSQDHVNLDVAHFLSNVTTQYSEHSSLEVLPEPESNDRLFIRAISLISKNTLVSDEEDEC
jgi:hypothetical protein